jgi:hypothetical protein
MFFQKLFQSGGRDRLRRIPSGFPGLKGFELGGQPGCLEDLDRLRLAQTVCFPPGSQSLDDRSDSFLGRSARRLFLFVEELAKRCSRHGMGCMLSDLPLLKSSDGNGYAGVC